MFQENSVLKEVLWVSQVSDTSLYWIQERLIFPIDKNGVKGKIVYQKEVGSYKDEATNWIEINKVSRELEWKNRSISPNPYAEN